MTDQPRVVVKRSRAVVGGAPGGPAAPESQAAQVERAALPPYEDKGPRVFRVEPPAVEAPVVPAVPEPAVAAEAPAVVRRKRRVDADKRPGPVVVAFQAPAPPVEAPAEDAASATGLSKTEVRSLMRLLARLDPVFEDIRRAQAFRFVEAR